MATVTLYDPHALPQKAPTPAPAPFIRRAAHQVVRLAVAPPTLDQMASYRDRLSGDRHDFARLPVHHPVAEYLAPPGQACGTVRRQSARTVQFAVNVLFVAIVKSAGIVLSFAGLGDRSGTTLFDRVCRQHGPANEDHSIVTMAVFAAMFAVIMGLGSYRATDILMNWWGGGQS